MSDPNPTLRPARGGTRLRRARAEDIPQMEALLTAEHLPPYGLRDYLDTFFVLEEGGRVAGCAGLEVYAHAALLRSVVVAPQLRGSGHGRRLTEAALAEARRRGVRRLYLFTVRAAGFFARYGFREAALDEFEEAVRESMQYQAVSQLPELRERLRAMRLELDSG